MAGSLHKKGELNKAFKKRWFTLEDAVLAWHEDERGAAAGKPPKGSLDLTHGGGGEYAKVEAEEGATAGGRWRFHVTPVGGATRSFEAASAAEREEWVKALCRARQTRKW